MIDAIRATLSSLPAPQRLNGLREYLQWMVLQALDESGHRAPLIFTGGTCLRVVHGIARFSDDLDFSLAQKKRWNLGKVREDLLTHLKRRGIEVEASNVNAEGRAVGSFWIQFPKLLFPLGLSSQRTQKLSLKFEVDQNPPKGGHVEEYFRQAPLPFLVNHYDLPSLFATKAHALLFRGFDKGRDYYDFLFFLGRKIKPNLKLFQNAVRQTHSNLSFETPESLWSAIRIKIEAMDQSLILRDVRPFLLNPDEERFLTKPLLLKALAQAEKHFN